MAQEYITLGGVIRCREVTRYIDANGVLHETWGDILPLSRCSTSNLINPARNKSLMLGSFQHQQGTGNLTGDLQIEIPKPVDLGDYVITETGNQEQEQDQDQDSNTEKIYGLDPTLYWILIAAAGALLLYGAYRIFK